MTHQGGGGEKVAQAGKGTLGFQLARRWRDGDGAAPARTSLKPSRAKG
ncbi:hypothetical protein QVM48_24945 [Pseudomonas soli]|uniref:Uncharacterized protein n=1 Tax=Pseudomonas soli TaxID=1306993 RepID=A0ABU7GVV0_9PSED|nr:MULTISPECIES: hypothetical protein [Pseudomonas]MDT3717487.1 hypothetical protein [Pseudomonas soli]MDT3734219.1 hypothetical protein [Pseudomonas soli]MEE1883144.1 hypothetical protein [Pseudomonas soli]